MMGPLCRTRPECLEPRAASNQTAGAHPAQVPARQTTGGAAEM
jgi:hypothetical protein